MRLRFPWWAILGTILLWPGPGSAWARQSAGTPPPWARTPVPAVNPYAWPMQGSGDSSLLFFLATQYRAAREVRAASEPTMAPAQAPTPSYRMFPGGPAAANYFGRTVAVSPGGAIRSPGADQRYRRYFGRR
ncbi:hypothetical protein [Tautonia sociabilis]|uniref:Uncharacterized protein n=1 Tax=Tautonia sociabilis TaxID=2080755 RepID=A0A432MQ51_9BACT|nr:hypothetical protein [Tautonia sociabilis]RUL89562.1 hypothetical protein TsocGM_01975 [Tautonia sociabilis]